MSRRALVDITLNGVQITKDISGDTLSLSYTDNASSDADDLTVSIQNRTKKWLYGWFPNTGDRISAKIVTQEWCGTLNCGEFLLDSVDMSGWPLIVSMRALDMPVNNDFCEVKRSRSWESAQLSEIVTTIAANAGLAFQYDAVYNPLIPFTSQSDKNDKSFLDELCKKHGLTMKMFTNKIIIYDMAEYEKKKAVVTLTEQSMTSFSTRGTITNAGYTGCTVRYADRDGKVWEYTHTVAGRTPKIYKHVVQVSGLAEAERVAKAKLRELNMGETTFSCDLPGNAALVATQIVVVSGFGNFDGRYFIDKATHKVGGGYTTNLEMHRVMEDG